MNRKSRELLLLLGDFVLFSACALFSLHFRQDIPYHSDAALQMILGFIPVFALWHLTFSAVGLYYLRELRLLISQLNNILAAALINWSIATMYFYLFYPYLELTPKTILLMTLLLSHAGAFFWRRLLNAMLRSRTLAQKVLFVADAPSAEDSLRELGLHPAFGYRPVEEGEKPDLIVADHRWLESNWNNGIDLFRQALEGRTPVVSFDDFYESVFGKISPEHAGSPSWLVEVALPRANSFTVAAKPVVDAFLAAALLVALSPLLLLAALLIRSIDGAPVFYAQRRLGYLGKEFVLWKFRTMSVGADAGGAFSRKEGEVTPLGRRLRRLRIDELPQLWNVVRGEMSLVGPRPEWVKEIEVLEKELPQYHLRHLVRPGITGWAQIHYRATDSAGDGLEKLRYDLYYIKNLSLALDLSILLKTVKRVLIADTAIASPHRAAPLTPPPSTRPVGSLLGRP